MDWESGERYWRRSSLLACFAVAQFLVACWLAMALYPGGYNAEKLFLSDLGVTTTASGTANGLSFWLFNGSLAVLACGTIPFYLFLWVSVPDRPVTMWIAIVSGIVSNIALLGIALTPYDQHKAPHEHALAIWIGGLFAVMLLQLFAIFRSNEVSMWGAVSPLLVLAAAANYVAQGIAMIAANAFSQEQIMNPMTAQKLLVLSVLAWYAHHSLVGALRVREARPAMDRLKALDDSAEAYAKTLRRRDR